MAVATVRKRVRILTENRMGVSLAVELFYP